MEHRGQSTQNLSRCVKCRQGGLPGTPTGPQQDPAHRTQGRGLTNTDSRRRAMPEPPASPRPVNRPAQAHGGPTVALGQECSEPTLKPEAAPSRRDRACGDTPITGPLQCGLYKIRAEQSLPREDTCPSPCHTPRLTRSGGRSPSTQSASYRLCLWRGLLARPRLLRLGGASGAGEGLRQFG